MLSTLRAWTRPRRLSRQALVLALTAVALVAAASSAAAAQVHIVRQGAPPAVVPPNTEYFTTIQAAVNASTAGDWVLVEPGTYKEAVKVTSAQSGIWIRGMNRNMVIIDGQSKAGNGVEVFKANNVYVENLTVRNFDTGSEAEPCPTTGCGNDIWWNGGGDSGKVGAHGWWGRYLTTYDTGLNGGYGIFTGNETEGEWSNIYASGFNDSGMYLGACQECDAKITKATMENNALGYSGSNSGGNLIIEKSLIRNNGSGIAPNSENPGDGPPPQDGECGRPNIENPNPEPLITTTRIKRCTIIRNNVITENNNLTVPINGSTAPAPWGTGVLLAGDYADLVTKNTITNNANDGILGFEFANPFTPENNFEGTLFFQFAGNKLSDNTFSNNGYRGGWPFTGDIAMMGGFSELFPGTRYPESHSVDNCAIANTMPDATFPAEIERTWGCQHSQTPSPGGGELAIDYLLTLPAEAPSAGERSPQPAPAAQPTMPNPCKGVPRNPLCR
jgi:hypothetical protein